MAAIQSAGLALVAPASSDAALRASMPGRAAIHLPAKAPAPPRRSQAGRACRVCCAASSVNASILVKEVPAKPQPAELSLAIQKAATDSDARKPHVALLSNRHPTKTEQGWAFGGVTEYQERLPYYVEEALERLSEKGLSESPDIMLVPGDKVAENGDISVEPQRFLNKADGTPLRWQDVKALPQNEADVEALRKRLGISEDVEDVVLFIHGFNTHYKATMYSANKIAASFKGEEAGKVAVLAYDWACTSGGSLTPAGLTGTVKALASTERAAGKLLPSLVTGYAVDSETARVSVRQLEWLLLAITSIPTVKNVHLLAHSMGNRVLSYAIDRFLSGSINRQDGEAKEVDDRPHKIGLCIFKQADLDPINLAETLARLEDWWRITGAYKLDFDSELLAARDFDPVVLAHPADGFLVLSEFLHSGMRRVGQYTAGRIEKIFNPKKSPVARDAYLRLVGSGENSQDFHLWLSAVQSHIPSSYPEASLAVKKVKEMVEDRWDAGKLDAWLVGEEGHAVKEGAVQLRSLLAGKTLPFEPTGTPGMLRNARPFKNKGWAGHSYFNDPVFQDYIARTVAAYKKGFGPLTVDPLGSYEDLAVAMWRMKQLWKCKPEVFAAQQHHRHFGSSAFEQRLRDAVYGRGQDILGITAFWKLIFDSKPAPEPKTPQV